MNLTTTPENLPKLCADERTSDDYQLAKLKAEIRDLQVTITKLRRSPNKLATINLWCLEAMLEAQRERLFRLCQLGETQEPVPAIRLV